MGRANAKSRLRQGGDQQGDFRAPAGSASHVARHVALEPAHAPGLTTALGHEAGIQDQQLPPRPRMQCPQGGHGQAREEELREPARMGTHRPAAVVPEVREVDARRQPLQQLHHVGEVDRLQFAAGHQYKYIAQQSHRKSISLKLWLYQR